MADPVTLGIGAMSLASTGLSALGQTTQASGQAAADTFKAEELDRAAQYGELQATQVSGQMTRNLGIQLSNLDTIRAAQRVDPSSPTSAMVRNTEEGVGTEQKTIKVDSILAQSQQDEASAAYERSAASTALLSGDIGAAGSILKGGAGLITSLGGGGGGGGNPYGPLSVIGMQNMGSFNFTG